MARLSEHSPQNTAGPSPSVNYDSAARAILRRLAEAPRNRLTAFYRVAQVPCCRVFENCRRSRRTWSRHERFSPSISDLSDWTNKRNRKV